MSFRFGKLMRHVLFLAGATAVAHGLIGGVAQAACGDWLAHRETAANNLQERPAGMSVTSWQLHLAPRAEPTPAPPCSGPSCRQAPPRQPETTAPPPGRSQDQQAEALVLADGVASTTPRRTTDFLDALRPRSGFPWHLDRPPRGTANP